MQNNIEKKSFRKISESEDSFLKNQKIEKKIVEALKTIYDPEIPVNIYELGLIYKIAIENDKTVNITMTLTTPGCPVAREIPIWVEDVVRSIPDILDVKVLITFNPPWTPDRMSEDAKIITGWF